MAATLHKYSQPTDILRCPNPTSNMRRDERRQELPPIGTYSWPNQPIYTLSDDGLSVPYPVPSSSLETYGFNHGHDSRGYSTAGYSNDQPSVDSTPMGSAWVDVPLDPNAIYHMPHHSPAWSGSANSESPYEYDRLVLRQTWEQGARDQWLRRNGIAASSADPQYDRFIPELRASEYAERYLTRSDVRQQPVGEAEVMRTTYSADPHEPQPLNIDSPVEYTSLPASNQYYQPHIFNDQSPQSISSSSINPSTIHDNISAIPSPSSTHVSNAFSLHPPYREPTNAYSPTDADSPMSLHPSTHALKLSASPVTVLSALDSDAAESPLSDSYHVRPTSPVRSPSTSEPVISEPLASPTNEPEIKSEDLAGGRAKSEDSVSRGHPAMGPIRRGNSAGDRSKNAAGTIRVHRPAGIKWNQRTRCAYINPVTGLQCRTSAGRGPDLERHLRTVHLREEARAVSDGLIPRDKAELLPPDWVMGDRLDFDCPHCAVRFTREDARDRHVKVQHQK